MERCPARRALAVCAWSAAALLLCALLLTPSALEFMSWTRSSDAGRLTARSPARFALAGKVTGLFPGAHKKLRLRITNPNAWAIRVLSLSVTPTGSNRPGCDASWIKTRKLLGLSLRVAAGGRNAAMVPVRVSADPPDMCRDARWPLRFSGRARRLR